ncbi:hypothetical protein ACINNAV72_1869 [Acinetobacter baumannii Naval-72]|nr:hypothetical protein ACINNAV72_1869 [Acinetobacter baumannii Naval-72]
MVHIYPFWLTPVFTYVAKALNFAAQQVNTALKKLSYSQITMRYKQDIDQSNR